MKNTSYFIAIIVVTSSFPHLLRADEDPARPKENPDRAADRPEGAQDGDNRKPATIPFKNTKEGEVFTAYDKDSDGFVTAEEIETMMEGKQNSRGRREIRKAVKRADEDNDEKLNFEEFKFWYTIGRQNKDAENR